MDGKEIRDLLFKAIQHHNESLLADLLNAESGQRLLDLPGENGNTLLHTAVIENDLNCIECLLEHGANPNVFDTNRSRTPLHLAVELCHTDIVRAFLNLEYINLGIRDDRNLTCHEIAQFCDNQILADIIKEKLDEVDEFRNGFYTVMNQACTGNQPNLVRELLEKYEKQVIEKLPEKSRLRESSKLFARSCMKELINWSSSSRNDVTLLFKSASEGLTEVCELLIEYGATANCNESTNYSPLYVAAYGGFTDTVRLLLDNFPLLIKEVTIEKWTVLHACCLQGHSDTAKLVLTYPYPEALKQRYVSRSGLYEYHFAYDLNSQDAAGQTVIYLAVSANDERLLDTLLQFNVQAKLVDSSSQSNDARKATLSSEIGKKLHDRKSPLADHSRIIPDRAKIPQLSNEVHETRPTAKSKVQRIIGQLHNRDASCSSSGRDELKQSDRESKYLVCPFEMDTYCDYNSKTALHLAVCQQYHSIATTLLVNGSNPNLPILSRESIKNDYMNSSTDTGLNWLRSSKSTCLREASRLNDEAMCDILIRYGASDNQDNLALQVAASNKNSRLISKFLSLKSNVDPEYKINKRSNVEFASRYKQNDKFSKSIFGDDTTTFSSMFPLTPVMVDWQNLKCIRHIDPQWLIDASLAHNRRLKHLTTSLIAITRLDLSSNNLKAVHPVIFRLPSLRELDLSRNRLEILMTHKQSGSFSGEAVAPTAKLIESHRIAMRRSKSSNLTSINLECSNIIDLNEPQEWDLPYLETLDLHDNSLISLPDCLFELPRLSELDISSNQLRQLPWSMWRAPSLKEVIASGNLLDDLPKLPSQTRTNIELSSSSDIGNSSIDDSGSPLLNQSISQDQAESSLISSSIGSESMKDCIFTRNTDISETQLRNQTLPLIRLNYWEREIDVTNDICSEMKLQGDKEDSSLDLSTSKITYLNLSHNSFTNIPPVLACVAVDLVRLNLSYNRITTLGDICLYPSKIKNIDLSNNRISEWFTVDQQDISSKNCFNDGGRQDPTLMKFLPGTYRQRCEHKAHQRLDGLKSLNLSYNSLKDIQISSSTNSNPDQGYESRNPTTCRDSRNSNNREFLVYLNITVLDLSYNKISRVPKNISELRDLSVLNLSGNVMVASLPAELGLATKLWNLGINGCNLGEPLKSIVESKTYKTVDVIGYLKSILEESKPYARMKLMLVGLQGIGKTTLLEQMRQEGSSSSRRRAPEHWTKRMGHSSRSNIKNQKGITLSTVGVDIHDWVFNKRTPRNQPNLGPVTFSTWDFGGQQEFYATHRYFLSKRSIYLVVWRLIDGIDGILGIQQWLVNIQSRASGSPVVIVGTHEDMVDGGERGVIVEQLQAEVHKRFVDVNDHDKCGLPRVIDSIVVSTKTKLNIKYLCNRIYDIVFSLRCPGSTERLLEQKIPATYLYLEEIVSSIVHDRQRRRLEPVMNYEEYKRVTSEQLKSKYNKVFRDLEPLKSKEINCNSELHQATRFLHENGVLLHYEDANLRDLYFLDPQWLCDILSHVVTIREINPHVKNGLMRIDDLAFLFKSVNVNLSGGVQSYIVNLLNKFEVALTWNSQYLLIPSLLPSNPSEISGGEDLSLDNNPKVRGRSIVRRYRQNRMGIRSTSIDPIKAKQGSESHRRVFEFDNQPESRFYRVILLRYLPAGFLARLQSDILSDPAYDDICSDIHSNLMQAVNSDPSFTKLIGSRAGWTCWKKGIKLSLQHESTINSKLASDVAGSDLLHIEETSTMTRNSTWDNRKLKIECGTTKANNESSESCRPNSVANKWSDLDITEYSNMILVTVPNMRLKIVNEDNTITHIEPAGQIAAKLLANSVDHIDNLLEDWYPSLGARFAHTLGGNYLVARVVPCLKCFMHVEDSTTRVSRSTARGVRSSANAIKFSSKSGQANESSQVASCKDSGDTDVYCYHVEQCILEAYDISSAPQENANFCRYSPKSKRGQRTSSLLCPKHGLIALKSIAPDIVFEDVQDSYRIDNEKIERCKLIGRGTFGFVFRGNLRSYFPLNQLGQADQEVALKLLQPVDPGPEADSADLIAYRSAKSNWIREPFHSACKSYCTARHEVNILQILCHPNIVHFIGLCVRPLAIVLELAPLGCLTDVFRNFKRAGLRIDRHSVQKTLVQMAKALEFLHQQRIIYRDLKAENVLVWSFPTPFATQPHAASVDLKLADYGISRQASSIGIWKGFAGTINFLAPEIMRHNGDEEYTEKVDCFSYGMFMYELLTLRPPFKHNEQTRRLMADGARPTIAQRDLVYPSYMIDLMSICWSQEPQNRPTASQIVSIVSTPEFLQLLDVAAIKSEDRIAFSGAIQYNESSSCYIDLWLGKSRNKTEILSAEADRWLGYQQLLAVAGESEFSNIDATCMCVIENKIWFCDSNLKMHILPLGVRVETYTSPRPKSPDETINRLQTFSLNLPKKRNLTLTAKQLTFVNSAHCIIILLTNGQLWLHQLDSSSKQLDDGSMKFECMVIKDENIEFGSPSDTKTTGPSKNKFLIYCGQSDGISCLEMLGNTIQRHSILPLVGRLHNRGNEPDPAPSSPAVITSIITRKNLLWTSAGCTIHLWDLKSRCVERKLDCWKLVPCSESLESINIEQYYQQARSSSVSSMVHSNNQLFVGTSHGCLMVVEADSMKPIIVFRPYESNIRIIAPTLVRESGDDENSRYLVTIGSGYRDLLKRYVNSLDDSETDMSDAAILWSANYYNL